ncbi:DUF1501 domain-containing protein [Algibacillus agarilyticus]|uniref:DUF1501 domain-containing protein n=1 Tax=Algibacillus agarilyticus TaxID=2234133 RepID=UPI000DCF95D4|nr:DUF1501 domain-containing protein [Algibacillus agarilyticus]
MQRRDFIKTLSAGLTLFSVPAMSAGLANSSTLKNKKVIWLVLRGAVDTLHTLVPSFDENLKILRPKLVEGLQGKLNPLEKGFSLHGRLSFCHELYLKKQFLPIVAVGSGYGARSHFDGQDYLESGLNQIDHDSGWLGRAIKLKQQQGVAIARSLPISMRGSTGETWYPSRLKDADDDIYSSLMKLYKDDALLHSRLSEGLATEEKVGGMMAEHKKGKFIELAQSCATLMKGNEGTPCAMLEMGGWDTHNNQLSRLDRQFKELDKGLQTLHDGLGDDWQNTLLIIASEFGRTARENGTGGTDHGTGSALMLAGGAVAGGKVLGQWPGLKDEELFENRDLKPTTNTFSWISAALNQHWSMPVSELAQIFPDHKPYKTQLIV